MIEGKLVVSARDLDIFLALAQALDRERQAREALERRLAHVEDELLEIQVRRAKKRTGHGAPR